MLHVSSTVQIPDSEFEVTFARSGGPGGQNVNKVNSKAVLRWDAAGSPSIPGGVRHRFLAKYASRLTKDGHLVIHSQRYRDQARNTADCKERLKQMLLQVERPPVARRPTRPSRGAKERRLQNKKQNSDRKRQRRKPDLSD